jgi:hypothetical protein
MDPELQELILERGPIGRWRSDLGTFDMVTGDEINFAADHTGWLRHYSALFGEQTIRFQWWMERRARLRIEVVEQEDGEKVEEDDEEGEIEMEFRLHQTDIGERTVLVERSKDRFWLVMAPLRWSP